MSASKKCHPRSVATRDLLLSDPKSRSLATLGMTESLLHIPLECSRSDLGPVDHAMRVHGDALGGARRWRRFGGVGDECRYRSIARAADANAALPTRALL